MATTPPVATSNVSLTFILTILQIALTALETVPVIGGDVKLAAVFISIIQNALSAYHAAAGVPLDLTKIPLEQPVP